MVSLEELEMTVWFEEGRSGDTDLLAQVLRCVQSSHLQKCVIGLRATQHWCTRDDLLNTISGEAMQQCLQNLLSIPEFIISLRDNDAAFGEDWWTTEITKNLPASKDMLTIKVEMWGRSIACFIEGQHTEYILNGYEEGLTDLWTEDLQVEAASPVM